MNASLRRTLSSLINKFAPSPSVDTESCWSQEVDIDDISPDDSVSNIDCDDDWLASEIIDDVRPEDSISNVCVRDPESYAYDAGEQGILSKEGNMNSFDDDNNDNVAQSNKDVIPRDEASMDTWKRSSRRHLSLTATIGHPVREQHVLDVGGVKIGFQDLKITCDASEDVDDTCPGDTVRNLGLDADDESAGKRDLTLNSDRNRVKEVSSKCAKWNLSVDESDHFVTSECLQGKPESFVFVAGNSTRGDFAHKISASLDARGKREELSFGISTTAPSECDQDLDNA
eukprot:TRINITY_DN6600_c0_g1_i1.p1 TRINITY_DN6600_c0_g1~~TRINITY_DN6600_c0_g1_i1.p1  ORF type:complete len:312 (-),score=50.31 TRINITY_DN6600_c0_g1_i1:213-1070(-)